MNPRRLLLQPRRLLLQLLLQPVVAPQARPRSGPHFAEESFLLLLGPGPLPLTASVTASKQQINPRNGS
jgi:hypothetical protein